MSSLATTMLLSTGMNLLLTCIQALQSLGVERSASVFEQRLVWDDFMSRHRETVLFTRHLRMKAQSFDGLVAILRDALTRNEDQADRRGGVIIPEIRLYATIRWLAGASYSDIVYFCGISVAAFYCIVWDTIYAIINHPSLEMKFPQTLDECKAAARGFASISDSKVINNCVGCG